MGVNMFEASCNGCEAVYSIEDSSMPQSFKCLCGSEKFSVKENTLVVA